MPATGCTLTRTPLGRAEYRFVRWFRGETCAGGHSVSDMCRGFVFRLPLARNKVQGLRGTGCFFIISMSTNRLTI